jgi:hypothetical protein
MPFVNDILELWESMFIDIRWPSDYSAVVSELPDLPHRLSLRPRPLARKPEDHKEGAGPWSQRAPSAT